MRPDTGDMVHVTSDAVLHSPARVRDAEARIARLYLGLILGFLLCAPSLPAQADSSRCLFSGPPKSSLAWESGLAEGAGPLARDELLVRVVSVHTGKPIANARVLWNPGARWALTDSTGAVSIRALKQGHYELRVVALGFISATDSITLGFDGVRVVAALAFHRGDIVCLGLPRQPSNER